MRAYDFYFQAVTNKKDVILLSIDGYIHLFFKLGVILLYYLFDFWGL